MNAAQKRVFDFLTSFVGNLNAKTELPTVCDWKFSAYRKTDNSRIQQLDRSGTSSNCSHLWLCPSTLSGTSLEFTHEFRQVLSSELS